MNWLAHLYLSDDHPGVRLGNLVADLVKGKDRQRLSPDVKRGIAAHQKIDTFTDCHPVFSRSRRRVPMRHDRFAGILIDIFYDHFLADLWGHYAQTPLDCFTAEIYQTFPRYESELPESVRELLARMAQQDWLGSYRTTAGIESVLVRLSRRIAERVGIDPILGSAIDVLHGEYAMLRDDFQAFFPEIRTMAALSRNAASARS